MQENKKQWGFYSPKQSKWAGTCFYEHVSGQIVEVTEVSESPLPYGVWDDYVPKGEVKKWIGKGIEGQCK